VRRIVLAVAATLVLSGSACGGDETVTQEDLDRMSQENVLAMGNCQLRKLQEAEGQEGVERFTEEMVDDVAEAPSSEEVVPVQVELSEMGYNCPEYLPE
jgi:hypothetical protein